MALIGVIYSGKLGGTGEVRAGLEQWEIMVRRKGRGRALQARKGLIKIVRGGGKQVFYK